MILKGSQRGGAKQLALHLLNDRDNDKIEVHSINGFIADDLEGALTEIHAIARATRCRQFMFSLSLSPPKGGDASKADYEAAIDQAAKRLGLQGQPHVVIFHEKAGRRHAHVVFSRIDGATMKAINLPFFKERLNGLAHELYLTHGWEMPEGFKGREHADPLNYGLEEYQTAKRAKADPKNIKARLLRCWEQADSAQAFAAALEEEEFWLCRGDRRGFVLLDRDGNVYSLSRWLGQKPKVLRERLGDPAKWPPIKERRRELEALPLIEKSGDVSAQCNATDEKLAPLQRQLARMEERHRLEQAALGNAPAAHIDTSPSGLKRLWRWLNGQATKQQNQHRSDAFQELTRRQDDERRALESKIAKFESRSKTQPGLTLAFNRDLAAPSREDLHAFRKLADRIRRNPDDVLDVVTEHKAVFTRSDIARALHRFIDDPSLFQSALAKACSSDRLVTISHRENSQRVRFSTHEIIALEKGMIADVQAMASTAKHAVQSHHVALALSHQDKVLRQSVGASLSDEQQAAAEHVTGPEQLSTVIGLAGAGKSTMLAAARSAWERHGYRVLGATLAGKAADGLYQSAGISSRTLASFEKSWENGLHELGPKDVLVIDEAGMVGTRQLARFVTECRKKEAKLVLVGDPEQLQPINAGAPFRAIADEIGYARLDEVRRQKLSWQQQASRDFAEGRHSEALAAYDHHGAVNFAEDTEQARAELVQAYLEDWQEKGSDASRLALAHRRIDVRHLNAQIRAGLKDMGALENEMGFKTRDGKRAFAAGDRIVFLQNDRDLGVRNGLMGTVEKVETGKLIIRPDQSEKNGKPKRITVSIRVYDAIDHGYATTIHKSQGATIDRSFVLASRTLDRHLTYVAMTRHKHDARLFAGHDEFADIQKLVRKLSHDHAKENTTDHYDQDYLTNEDTVDKKMHQSFSQTSSETIESIRRVRNGDRFHVCNLEL